MINQSEQHLAFAAGDCRACKAQDLYLISLDLRVDICRSVPVLSTEWISLNSSHDCYPGFTNWLVANLQMATTKEGCKSKVKGVIILLSKHQSSFLGKVYS